MLNLNSSMISERNIAIAVFIVSALAGWGLIALIAACVLFDGFGKPAPSVARRLVSIGFFILVMTIAVFSGGLHISLG